MSELDEAFQKLNTNLQELKQMLIDTADDDFKYQDEIKQMDLEQENRELKRLLKNKARQSPTKAVKTV